MKTANEFLKAHGLDLADFDNEALLKMFGAEMDAGLGGFPSSLAMIPAFIDLPKVLPKNQKVAVLDAGGTNLRAALIAFDADGKAVIEKVVKHEMPGAKTPVDVETFYGALIEQLEKVIPAEVTKLGFCFSYPAEVTPDRDAKLLLWTKQIKAPEIVGQYVGAELKKRLAARGRKMDIVVLNDTVATLLAGYTAAPNASSFVGFILGTGTNTAYIAKTDQIFKSPAARAFPGQMTINVESGGFNKVPRCDFDKWFDATLQDPGSYLFEKCISGVYMGGLGLSAIKQAAREGLFSSEASAEIAKLEKLDNKALDDFCASSETEPLFAGWASADKQMVVALCRPLYERAARLTAVNIAIAVIKSGEGKSPDKPVAVNVDGSTYHKTKAVSFDAIVRRELDCMLGGRGIHYQLIRVDEAPVFGAAVAGLC